MADDDEASKKPAFLHNQETFQRAPETQGEHRFPTRAAGIVDVPVGSRGPRSLYLRRNGDSFGFTLRHFIIYPPESIQETDGRHAAVGALLTPMDTIFVKNVAERGPARQAGLQRGDRILYVNGESVSHLSYSQVVQRIQKSPPYLHLLVVPKEEDILQKYFAEAAYNPLSNQNIREPLDERHRQQLNHPQYNAPGFRVDAPSWKSLQKQLHHSIDYSQLVPRKSPAVQSQKSADNIYSSVRDYTPNQFQQGKSAENIYSTPRDNLRSSERKSLEIYTEPIINDSTQRPRAQPQVPLYRKMGRRASEGSNSVSENEYSLMPEELTSTMQNNKSSYTTETYNNLAMPALNYRNVPGCRLSLDTDKRRESSSSLTSSIADGSKDSLASFDSSSTLTGQDTDNSVVMNRLRKSVQEKEEFLRRPSNAHEQSLIQREFYGRPKKLDKPMWPPNEPQEMSPSRINKPQHYNFQRVKNDIENEREITQNHEQPKHGKSKEFQFNTNLSNIQETCPVSTEPVQVNGSSEAEDRRNYPPNKHMVSKRARQFETGRMMPEDDPLLNDRTSYHLSELARITSKRVVPNVAVRTREFETMSNEPRRDTSSSSTNSAAVLRRSYRDSRSLDSSDLPNHNQSNGMRMRSNSTGSWVYVMQNDSSVETNSPYLSDSTTRTGPELMDTSCTTPTMHTSDLSPLIPEPVERLQILANICGTPAPPQSHHKPNPIRPTQLDLGAPKRPSRHLRPPQTLVETPPPPSPFQPVCDDKPLVVRRSKNTNLTDEDRVMRRESYLKATEGGRMHLETGDYSDGDISSQMLRSAHRKWRPPLFPGDIQPLRKLFEDTTTPVGGSVSGGSNSSVSLEREKNASSPCEKDKQHFLREGSLHCKITEIDGKRSADRSWRQVWAVLRGPKLLLFKDRHHQSPVGTSEVADQSLASGVDMRGSCVQVAEDYTKRKNVFRVSSVLPCRSELLLQADNTVDLAEWVQALQEQVASSTDVEAKLDQMGANSKQQAVPQTVPAVTSIQVPQQTKSKLPSLRNRSPTGQSPVSKTRKPSQVNDPSTSPKSKTWRGRFSKQLRKIHQGASSPSSPTAPECSTFGNPLEHCLPSPLNPFVPKFVETCTEIVESRGLEMVGIYRVPGNNAAVTALTEEVNKSYDEITQIDPRWNDVHVVSSLLKSFFRKMPDSLLTTTAYPLFIAADKIENPNLRIQEIRRLIKSLPPHHYNTLKHLILHLRRVVDNSEMNKMEARNLAIVFGPTIVRAGEDSMEKMVNDMTHQCKIVESLLLYADWFFTEDNVESLNLPAPIAPAEIFSNEPEANTQLLKENISKVEGLNQIRDQKEKNDFIQSLFSAAQRRCRRKGPKSGSNSSDSKDEPTSPMEHKTFSLESFNNNTSDLKNSTTDETKPNSIQATEVDGGGSSDVTKSQFFNYKTGPEEMKRRIENFIQETQSNLQRPRKPESNSNNSLELRLPNQMSSSANNVRHSLTVNLSEPRVITKTHSASNVFSKTTDNGNGRNTIGSMGPFNKNCSNLYFNQSGSQSRNVNSLKDSYNDLGESLPESKSLGLRRGSSAENISTTVDLNANGNLKKLKYENEGECLQRTASLDSLNKLQTNLDDGGDLVSAITKIFDEKKKELNPSVLSTDNIPYVDESPERLSRQSISHVNKENIPSSPKLYRNPSLHKNQYIVPKFLTTYNKDMQKLKEKHELTEKDEDSTMCTTIPDNERHILNTEKITLCASKIVNTINGAKLKRSESLNKPERTVSPMNNKLKRSESLNKTSDKLKRSDSLTKNEKTESNISKKREITSSTRRTTKDFTKLKRKNGMPERSIKRRHTVGGTKDPDKITYIDNRCHDEVCNNNESVKEKNLRTSSPDLSSTKRLLYEIVRPEEIVALRQHLIGSRPQSFPDSTVFKVPLESRV